MVAVIFLSGVYVVKLWNQEVAPTVPTSPYLIVTEKLVKLQREFADFKQSVDHLSPVQVDWNLLTLEGCKVGSKLPYGLTENGWVQTNGLDNTHVWKYYIECEDPEEGLKQISDLKLYLENITVRHDLKAIELTTRVEEVTP
jgi:hypothetical protein